MGRKKKTRTDPTAPLLRAPGKVGQIKASSLVSELRAVYEETGGADDMPDDTEVYGALVWAERHARQLTGTDPAVRRRAALTRVLLWEHLREQIDLHQSAAVDAARAAGASWADLTDPLAVRAPSAAYNKAQRLRAAGLTDGTPAERPVRRTPEAVTAAHNRLAEQEQAAEQRRRAAHDRHPLVAAAARRLLDQREHLATDEDTEYWLDEAATVLPDCTTPTRMESLERYLAAALRHLAQAERATGRPAARAPEALAAYAAVRELVTSGPTADRRGGR